MNSEEKQKQLEMKFVAEHPGSIVSASVLSVLMTSWSREEVQKPFDQLSPDIQNSGYGQEIKKYLFYNKNPQLGERYIDFSMQSEEGVTVKLSAQLGKVTLLSFWASWCVPCRQGNKNLVQTYQKFKPKGFEIVAVSLDTDPESWREAIAADQLIWQHLSDLERQNKAGLIYNISSVPDNFLIDADGRIIGRNLRGEQLNQELSKWLH